MGRHFDTLVELLKNNVGTDETLEPSLTVHNYLVKLVERATLFEFPLESREIRPHLGKDKEEYHRYLTDYLEMSQQYGHFLITPFKLTAIEDPESVVFFENKQNNKYRIMHCVNFKDEQSTIDTISIADITVDKANSDNGFPINVTPLYFGVWENKEKIENIENILPNVNYRFSKDIAQASVAYIEEVIYIMDPANFIIQKESNQSIKERERRLKKPKIRKPQKTIVRPHYICLSEEDTKSFLRRESKEPRPLHPVRGHWKILMSERYVNKQGQRIYIEQYLRGNGAIDGKNGWHYQVMVKESPTRIVPFNSQ